MQRIEVTKVYTKHQRKTKKRQQKRKMDKWFIDTKFISDTQLDNRYIKIIKAGKH